MSVTVSRMWWMGPRSICPAISFPLEYCGADRAVLWPCRVHYRHASFRLAPYCGQAMASWAEFEAAAPEFAVRVRLLMASRKHLTMATLRRDGSPRISGTEIEFANGQLRIGSMPRAVKALDLLRDPRIAVHGPTEDPLPGTPAGWTGEAKIAGTATEVELDGAAHRFV